MKWLRWLKGSQPESFEVQLARLKELRSDVVARRRRMNPDGQSAGEKLMYWLDEPEPGLQPRNKNEAQLARVKELRSDVEERRRRMKPEYQSTKQTLTDWPEQPDRGPQPKRKD